LESALAHAALEERVAEGSVVDAVGVVAEPSEESVVATADGWVAAAG